MTSRQRPWYAKGIRFECTQCGDCCTAHGEYDRVYLDRTEAESMAKLRGLSFDDFVVRHCFEEDGRLLLRFIDGKCGMLEGKRCGVYSARPVQCKTWPFWRENLSKRVWNSEIVPFCPGVGKGRVHSRAEIDRAAALGDEESTD